METGINALQFIYLLADTTAKTWRRRRAESTFIYHRWYKLFYVFYFGHVFLRFPTFNNFLPLFLL